MKSPDVTNVLQRSLQAAMLRQTVLSNNVANVNTPGFKRSHVEFETELAKALSGEQNAEAVQPKVVVESDTSIQANGNNVDLELEMTEMAQNQIYYAALARQLSDQFSRLRTAIRGGNG